MMKQTNDNIFYVRIFTKLQKRYDWLQSIEDRVLFLHFEKQSVDTPVDIPYDAQTISFYGRLLHGL